MEWPYDQTMASSWREDVRDLIYALGRESFTLSDLYAHEAHLAGRHPENSFVREKIRQVLQQLRDRGEIDFAAPGQYRLINTWEAVGPEVIDIDDVPEDASTEGEPGAPDSVPLELVHHSAYTVSATASREAVRREQALVHAYSAYLKAQGHQVSRRRVPTRSSGTLWTDLHDDTEDVLYEAKAASSREAVRLAIGQLLDYQRYVHASRLAVLLPARPSRDMCDLLKSLNIGLVYESGGTFAGENLSRS